MSSEVIAAPSKATEEFELIQRQANMFFQSGLFSDTKNLAQAAVKIMAGREMGLGPFEAMRDVNIIQGKTALAAAQVAARIQRSGGDWTPIQYDNDKCILRFNRGGKDLTPDIEFGAAEAKALGLLERDNYRKQARTMYFWRAMTMGARMFFPGVFGGPIYTTDELRGGTPEDLPEPKIVEPEPEQAPEQKQPEQKAKTKAVEAPKPFEGNPFGCVLQTVAKDSKLSINGKIIAEIFFSDPKLLGMVWTQHREKVNAESQSALSAAMAMIRNGQAKEPALAAFQEAHGYSPEYPESSAEAA
jgi:hypothetical protein